MEQDALVRVLMRERARLLAFARAIVADAHAAEDVLQDVSASVVSKAAEIRDEQHLIRWLQRAARLRSIDVLRRRRRTPEAMDDAVLDRLEAAWGAARAPVDERLEALRSCVERLSPYGRRLVALRYGDGLTGPGLAHALSRSLNTVYVALSRVHLRLRTCVVERLGGAIGEDDL